MLDERIGSVFERNCETGKFTIKVRPLDQLRENLDKLESVPFLDASVYKSFSVVVKIAYQ